MRSNGGVARDAVDALHALAMEDSTTSTKRPAWLVFFRCMPPHSSTLMPIQEGLVGAERKQNRAGGRQAAGGRSAGFAAARSAGPSVRPTEAHR